MRRLSSESGAVLLNIILAMVLLIGINTFVIDYGVMWVGRGQAQNSADAGALAGAVAMAFDDYNDRLDTGPAKRSAYETTQWNSIWGAAPAVNITTDVTFPMVPANPCADNSCIRVDVYRNVAKGNPLPALFGTAIGLTSQGVRAMAIARAAAANASDCLKPWAIPDKWTDNHDDNNDGGWTDDDVFETEDGRGNPLPDADVYVAPTKDSPGTGFTVAVDLGVKVTLKTGSPQDALAPGVFHPIQLPLADGSVSSGGDDYRDSIAGCAGAPVGVGATLGMENGNMIGPTKQGVEDLIALDKDAVWDANEKAVKNSCAQATTPCAARSPRIVAIPIFDTGAYYAESKQNGNVSVKVVNILGFFIDKMQGNDVVGYITNVPGMMVNGPSVGNQSGFAKVVMLVR